MSFDDEKYSPVLRITDVDRDQTNKRIDDLAAKLVELYSLLTELLVIHNQTSGGIGVPRDYIERVSRFLGEE